MSLTAVVVIIFIIIINHPEECHNEWIKIKNNIYDCTVSCSESDGFQCYRHSEVPEINICVYHTIHPNNPLKCPLVCPNEGVNKNTTARKPASHLPPPLPQIVPCPLCKTKEELCDYNEAPDYGVVDCHQCDRECKFFKPRDSPTTTTMPTTTTQQLAANSRPRGWRFPVLNKLCTPCEALRITQPCPSTPPPPV